MDSTQSLPNDPPRLTDPASERSSPLFRFNAWLPVVLAVLISTVVYSQLVINGFGL